MSCYTIFIICCTNKCSCSTTTWEGEGGGGGGGGGGEGGGGGGAFRRRVRSTTVSPVSSEAAMVPLIEAGVGLLVALRYIDRSSDRHASPPARTRTTRHTHAHHSRAHRSRALPTVQIRSRNNTSERTHTVSSTGHAWHEGRVSRFICTIYDALK